MPPHNLLRKAIHKHWVAIQTDWGITRGVRVVSLIDNIIACAAGSFGLSFACRSAHDFVLSVQLLDVEVVEPAQG